MNFFGRQAEARRQSRWLVALFALALLAVVVAVNLIVLALLAVSQVDADMAMPVGAWMRTHPGTVVLTSLVVLAVVGCSSLFKSAQLASGGGVVARSLGGIRVERGSHDTLQRRLFNVVEEIAIASGVPLPEIYILEHEDGINAFAAGYLPANAAISVTRGALEKLNRAELQGVIAHEFGHVLNGDMRLNTRLIGLLFGLLVVALIGRTILRWGPSRTRKGGGAIVLAAMGVMVLGYVGVFFGRMIQAAVSRRRESLADASAVQFTRDPLGLKGALVKIGGLDGGSAIHAPEVDEVAHMLFASGMDRLFATHPPLLERIRTLDPSFDERELAQARADAEIAASEGLPAVPPQASKAPPALADKLAAPAAIAQLVGNFDTGHVALAREVAPTLPVGLLEQPGGPAAVLLALALDPQDTVRTVQLQHIAECLDGQMRESVRQFYEPVSQLERARRLPLLHEAIPELRRLPTAERRRLLGCLQRLILTDGRIEIYEYVLATLARVYLQDDLQPPPWRSVNLNQTIVELQTVFSTLAQYGAESEEQARYAYEIGMHHVLPKRRPPYNPVRGWPAALDRALKCLDRLGPQDKSVLVEALVKTVSHDNRLSSEESELLRAICAALHCPLPPLMG